MYTMLEKNYAGQDASGKPIYRVDVQCDTAADIPTPKAHWVAGSWLHVLENGGSLYTLGSDHTWYPQGFTDSPVTTEETAEAMAAYSPPEFDETAVEPEAEVQEDESV